MDFFSKAITAFISLLILTNSANASGLQLFELTGTLTGNAGAGDAARADDASTSFLNPAGLSFLKHQQLLLNAVGLKLDTTFTGQSRWFVNKIPEFNSGQQPVHTSGGTFNLIPSFYYAVPINANWGFGFNVAGPFGLSIDYSPKGFQRYSVTHARLVTIDISPSIGLKLTDKFALGMGIDAQRLAGQMQVIAGVPLKDFYSRLDNFDSVIENVFSDTAYGWHAGLLYQISPNTRLGLGYHSKLNHHATGTSTLTGPLANLDDDRQSTRTSTNLNLVLTLPAYTTLSFCHVLNPALTVSTSITYTQWSSFKNITIYNIAAVEGSLIPHPSNQVTATIPQHFHDTWRFVLGSDYKLNQHWTLRTGVGYDQSPVHSAYRNLLIPDSNRYIVSGGAQYQFNDKLELAIGWTHYFMQKGSIDTIQTIGPGSLHNQGSSKNTGNIFGLQLNCKLS